MTNKEKYKQAFSVIHATGEICLEVEKMKKMNKQHRFKTMVASVAACVVLAGSTTIVYAADINGIQRTIQLWMQGEQTEVTIQLDGNGSYNMNYTDSAGNRKQQGGGGVAFAPDGTEIPLSDEQLLEHLTAPDVEYEDDGSVWVYWFDQKIDITDKFENGLCYVKLVNSEKTLYLTVKYQDGYTVSPHKYKTP